MNRRLVGPAVVVAVAGIVAYAIALAAGFAAPPLGPGQISTVTQEPGFGGMDALYSGTVDITVEKGVACAVSESAGHRYLLVWPYGYRASDDGLAILDAWGNVVAEDGGEVSIGGGESTRARLISYAPCDVDGYWLVSSR